MLLARLKIYLQEEKKHAGSVREHLKTALLPEYNQQGRPVGTTFSHDSRERVCLPWWQLLIQAEVAQLPANS